MRWLYVSGPWSGRSWRYPFRRPRPPAADQARRGLLALLPVAALVLTGGCMNVGDAPAHPAPPGSAGRRVEGDRRGADPGRRQRSGLPGGVGARPDGAHAPGARLPEPSPSGPSHERDRDRSADPTDRPRASHPPAGAPTTPQRPQPPAHSTAPSPPQTPSEPAPPSAPSPPPSGPDSPPPVQDPPASAP
jgi:hypothetical protein